MIKPAKLRSLLKERRRVLFYNKINLWTILDEAAVGADLQMSSGLELSGLPDILLKEEEERTTHLNTIKKLLHSMPERTTLQFIVQSRNGDPERIKEYLGLRRAETGREDAELTRMIFTAKERFLSRKFTQKRRTFLFVTTYPQSRHDLPRLRWSPALDINGQKQTRQMHERRIQTLNSTTAGVADTLRSLGVKSSRLTNDHLSQYFFRHLNPSTPLPPGYQPKGTQNQFTARSLLARSSAESSYEHFRIDGVYHRAVNLLLLPENLSIGHLEGLTGELWPDYDLGLSIHCVNSEELLAKLKMSGNIAKALSFSSFASRYEAEQKYTELDEMIREVRGSTQKLFTFSFCLLFKNTEVSELEEKAAIGLKAYQELGSASGIIDNLLHEELFLSFLPNHSHWNPRLHVMNSDPLTRLVPLRAPWLGTPAPKMLLENPHGELVNMDLFDPSLPAKHAILIGTTGSGKSFTCNYLLTHFFAESEKNHVVIIDIGGSYRKLCQLFAGQYLNVELSDAYAFNPMPCKAAIQRGPEYDPDEIAYLTLILERMVLDQNENLNSLGETILEKAIKEAYRGLPAEGAPTLRDVRRALDNLPGDEETRKLANHYFKNFEVWTEGRYSKIFESSKRLELGNRLIVFDLERLGNHPRLQSVYFYVIREIIDSKLRDKSLKKMIVIDEGWRFFNDDIGSKLIENLYRTARKNNGMILSISQSPVDFLNTKAANAIITNSYVKYILKLTKGHELLPQFGFTPKEVEAIQSLSSVPRKFSELFLKFNDHSTVIRIEPCPLDYWICTTDAEDSLKEEKIRQAHQEWPHGRVLETLAEGGMA